MANLSNTSPWIGAGQGLQQAIHNVGAIQGIQRSNEQAQRENELYPLKKAALEREGAIQGLQLSELQRKRAILDQPADFTQNPLFQSASLEDQAQVLKMAEGIPKTVAGMEMLKQKLNTSTEFFDLATKIAVKGMDKNLAKLQGNYNELLKQSQIDPTSVDPGMLETAKQEYYNAFAKRDAMMGNVDKGKLQVTMNEMALTNRDLINKSPATKLAFQYSKQTGDPKLFEEVIKESIKNEKEGKLTEWDVYLAGVLKESKETGKPIDLKQTVLDFKQESKTFKVGDTRQVQKGDQNITEEYSATGWKKIGEGPKFNPNAVNVTAQQTQFVDPASGNPLVFDKKTSTYRVADVQGTGIAPRPVNPSSTEREKTASLEVIDNQLGRIEKAYSSKYVGIVSGPIGAVTQLSNPKEAAFRQLILDVKDSLLRARSGAQINEQEYARLAKLVPDFGDSEAQFKGKMESFKTSIKNIISERKEAQRQGGVYVRGNKAKVGRFVIEEQ